MTDEVKVKAMIGGTLGVCGIAALALGWFLYDAADKRSEAETELDSVRAEFRRYYAAKPFPSKVSVDGVKTNEAVLTAWYDQAKARAARGDTSFPAETPPVFKQRLQTTIRTLSDLPGSVEGKIVRAGFWFGFDKYLGENDALPAVADLPALALQLDTMSRVVKLLTDAGVGEIRRAEPVVQKAKAADDDQPKKKKNAKNVKKAKSAEPAEKPPVKATYAFTFTARPAAFVAALNALAADTRFFVTENLSFKAERDAILEHIAARDEALAKKNAPQQTGRRRRRAAAFESEAPAAAEKKVDILVTDPELDGMVTADITVSVYDFNAVTK